MYIFLSFFILTLEKFPFLPGVSLFGVLFTSLPFALMLWRLSFDREEDDDTRGDLLLRD